MAEFTVVNPRRRSRGQSDDSVRNDNLISESAQKPAVKKQKNAEEFEPESDKENNPKTLRDDVDQIYGTYGKPSTAINWETKGIFCEPRVFIEAEKEVVRDFLYEPSGSLLRDDSAVPEHLRFKKYDTKPPPTPSRDQILAAAERLVSARKKRVFELDDPDTDSEYNYNLGPISKRRKKENSKHPHHVKPTRILASSNHRTTYDTIESDLGPKKTVVDGRTMTTATKVASKMQKLVPGFPLPQDPFPEDFTLTELCTQYPNHIFGDNLYPFLQYAWSATKIAKLLPDQSQVAEDDRVTANAIASRLRKAKVALEKVGRYNSLMAAPKSHAELWNNVSKRESTGADIENEDDVERMEVAKVSNDEDEDTSFVKGHKETIA